MSELTKKHSVSSGALDLLEVLTKEKDSASYAFIKTVGGATKTFWMMPDGDETVANNYVQDYTKELRSAGAVTLSPKIMPSGLTFKLTPLGGQ